MLNGSKWLITESYETPAIHLPQISFLNSFELLINIIYKLKFLLQ
jgi:hypothetical protein